MIQDHSPSNQLHSVIYGQSDDRVLFVHGWSCRASDWDASLTALSAERALMAVDLPGHGESADFIWEDWTITGLARALVAAAQAHGVRRLTLVGHSMGGTVALEAARLWQEQYGDSALGGVILVDTFGLPYGDMDEVTIASIETPFQQDFVAAMHYLVDNTTAAALSPATRSWIRERMASGNPQKLLPIWSDLLRWSPDAAFTQLHCPLYAINGEHIPAAARARCAPFVEEVVLPGAHHFPQFEQPEAFLHALRQRLTS